MEKKVKIILFGAGKNFRELLRHRLRENAEVLFVCDNDPQKWGIEVEGYVVEPPGKIKGSMFDYVFITPIAYQFVDEIVRQLTDMGIWREKILYPSSYSEYIETELDRFFLIEKKEPVPFKKGPAETYQDYVGETAKSHARREREGFFQKYCRGEGLDIGYGADIIVPGCSGWDIRNGDAQYMEGVEDGSFDFVYSSHCLEHMRDVRVSLRNWFRLVKRGGYLILAVPHRDLYEKKRRLPSRWNMDHKHMFLIGKSEYPDTLDIVEEIRESLADYDIKYVKACDEGHTVTDPMEHSDGEYQIEIVIQKMTADY